MTSPIDPRLLIVSARARRIEGGDPPHRDPDLERIRRGYFRPAAIGIRAHEQYQLRIHAAADARQATLVFSHASAASLWGCPLMQAQFEFVHATQPGVARRTTAGTKIHRSALSDEHIVTLPNGLNVTSKEWTAVELAASGSLPGVLLPLDHLLGAIARERGLPGKDVRDELVGTVPGSMKGRSRAIHHLGLADGRSGSAGESLSRGQMALLGVPMPELQVAFARIDQPGVDIVDFDWPDLGCFGEFDGAAKYVEREYAGDRTPAEVLWDEKAREDRIRRHRPRGVRWGWNDAISLERMRQVLARAGIEPARRR